MKPISFQKVNAPRSLTRRIWLQSTVMSSFLSPGIASVVPSSDDQDCPRPLNRFPRMVQEFFVQQLEKLEIAQMERRRNIQTMSGVTDYLNDIKNRIHQCFGTEPKRTKLNPRITGTIEREGYRIEKIIFFSRPGFPVTANLYIPTGHSAPFPGVIGTCGHSASGKAEPAYQAFAQGLAKRGFLCLIYDPIGQGERLQYLTVNHKPRLRSAVAEHLYAGNQQLLVGEVFAMWRAWDGIRALDYLLTRNELDPKHLGVTGNSGGGTMTTWLCALDPRWTMAAPSCFITSFRNNLENELPADIEQCPPQAISQGLDHDDFLAVMTPKPVIILAKERDFFDVRGTIQSYNKLKELYKLHRRQDAIDLFIGPSYHGFTQENREAMYNWFSQAVGKSPPAPESDLSIEKEETLWCCPSGQTAQLENTQTVFHFTSEKSQSLKKNRPALKEIALCEKISHLLKLPETSPDIPPYRILRNLSSRQYPLEHATTYAVETEPGIHAIVYRLSNQRFYSRPPLSEQPAILYIAHLSSDSELRVEPLIQEAIDSQPDYSFYACDVRGIGESQPNTCGENSFHHPYGSDYFYAAHSLMIDRPYVGQKTWDVLRILTWLKSAGHTQIHLIGRGWGALPATFAALLHKNVQQVTLKHALTSYQSLAETEDYNWPLSTFIPNVLAHFDLPDCYRDLGRKNLRQISPRGPLSSTGIH